MLFLRSYAGVFDLIYKHSAPTELISQQALTPLRRATKVDPGMALWGE